MNPRDLETLAMASMLLRSCGKTTQLATAAKNIGAKLVCANKQHADQVASTCDTITIDDVLKRGTRGPFIFDHYALERVFFSAANEIDFQIARIEGLKARINESETRTAKLLEAAKLRWGGNQQHNDTCSKELASETECNCGHDELAAALKEFEGER